MNEQTAEVFSSGCAASDPDFAALNLDRALGEEPAPGAVHPGVTVDDDVPVRKPGGNKIRVRDDLEGAVPLVPEGLGIVAGLGLGPEWLELVVLHPPAAVELLDDEHRIEQQVDLAGAQLTEGRRKLQLVFQDPFSSLNPRQRVGDIIGEPLLVHGIASGKDLRDFILALI